MKAIEIVLDSELRIAADEAARSSPLNRSQSMREALRVYLQRLESKAREDCDRAGYARNPPLLEEAQGWESEAAWPDQPASLRG
jgi:hypothetical protein